MILSRPVKSATRARNLRVRRLGPWAACLGLATAGDAQTLRAAADKAAIHIGIAMSGGIANGSNTALKNIISTEFNTVVCENDMKWDNTERTAGTFTFTGGDRVVAFAQTNNQRVRGHTLVWHSQATGAESGGSTREEMLRKMKLHIDSVAGRYRGKILEWDVVNEAVADGGGANGLRTSFWHQRIGPDFIDSAFVWARKADPTAILVYNDYGAENMGSKSNQVYNLVRGLKERGIPIDGVGLQCHFSGSSIQKAAIDENIKRIGSLGLRVAITELDIVDASQSTTPWKDLMDVCVANYNCTTFMQWGVYDAASWRASGGTCNCLIYNTQLQPKPIHGVLLASMNAADPAVVQRRITFGKWTTRNKEPVRFGKAVRANPQLDYLGAATPTLFLDGRGRLDLRGRRLAADPAVLRP